MNLVQPRNKYLSRILIIALILNLGLSGVIDVGTATDKVNNEVIGSDNQLRGTLN